ncbi:MAG: energy transducer TonB [Bacteroidia bacterium]|nr:energy transducer TonB [Bacteroidia bacterium]
MITSLLRYYWQVLKNGKPQPTKEIDPVYGRKELQKNQIWYGMTALAIVGGLAIYLPLAVLHFYVGEKERSYMSTSVCRWPKIPYKSPEHLPAPNGALSQGTKVHLLNFQIPAPQVRHKIRMDGIANDQYILDPKSVAAIIDIEEAYIIPELDSVEEVLEYEVPASFDLPLIFGEEVHFCCFCFPGERDYGIGEPPYFPNTFCKNVDSEPEPVNLKEIMKVLKYPQLARDAGISGTVVLRIIVDKYGNYISHRAIKEVHPILLKEVEKEASKLNFVPAIWKGEPVPFAMNIPFRFELKN